MTGPLNIRDSGSEDLESLKILYRESFPDEDLVPLVQDLLTSDLAVISLTAEEGGAVIAHIAFTLCGIADTSAKAALLGPLAVAATCRKRGVARSLIETGITRSKQRGARHVLVLGDPKFYAQFGFAPEQGIFPPYKLPDEWRGAWQSVALSDRKPIAGELDLPDFWRREELWLP